MKPERVTIPCGQIALEGVLHLPDGTGLFPAIVVCHPHPLYGGDMDNNVVMTICECVASRSIAALRFNFRGAGGSGGSFGGGVKEQDDIRAALGFLSARKGIDSSRLGVAGYSFGGMVAFPVAQSDTRVKALALVSPALRSDGWQQLAQYQGPKLVLLGDADAVVPFAQLKEFFTGNKDFQLVAGADHFWWGFEETVSEKTGRFFETSL